MEKEREDKIGKLTSGILSMIDNTEHVTVGDAITAIAMASATILAVSIHDVNMNERETSQLFRNFKRTVEDEAMSMLRKAKRQKKMDC